MPKAESVHSTRAQTRALRHPIILNPLSLSRRGVMAALAAGAAVNVPVIAGTAAFDAAPPPLTDTLILDLGCRYDAALTAEEAACEALNAACDAYRIAEPKPPDVLRHRILDHGDLGLPLLGGTDHISADGTGDFYCAEEIGAMRTARYAMPTAQARADAILAAWDGHQAACESLADRLGLDSAHTAYRAAVDARRAIGDAIVGCRATTLQGVAVRARIAAGLLGDDLDRADLPTDEAMMFAIVRDLVRMA